MGSTLSLPQSLGMFPLSRAVPDHTLHSLLSDKNRVQNKQTKEFSISNEEGLVILKFVLSKFRFLTGNLFPRIKSLNIWSLHLQVQQAVSYQRDSAFYLEMIVENQGR